MSMVINGTSGITFPDGSLQGIGVGRRNLIINGAMQVAQRGTSAVITSDGSNEGYQTLDRFYMLWNSSFSGAMSSEQSTDAPDGFGSSLKLVCTTTGGPDASSTDLLSVSYAIEAQDLQSLAFGSSSAKDITLSFYIKGINYSDPISVAVYTPDGTTEYFVKSVPVSSSWTRQTVTIPGSTTATINNDNGAGLKFEIVLAGSSGGTYAASSDSSGFSTTRVDFRNDIGNFLSSTSNELYITGVQLEVGSVATPFEHRSYGEELALCQRYYQEVGGSVRFQALPAQRWNATNLFTTLPFIVPMRASPTLGATTASDIVYFAGNNQSNALPVGSCSLPVGSTTHGITMIMAVSFTPNNQYAYSGYVSNTGALTLDAEL